MGSFWSELKRRNVVRVGIAYCAAGWVAIQIASVLFPLFGAPTWILKVVTTLVFLGFPLALVFAWAFELTPQGLKRTDDVPREVSTPRTGRRLDFLIIGVLAVAVALFALDKFVWDTGSPAVRSRAGGASVEPAPQASGGTRNSIAVLPFVNMSNDPEQEYFSDGIAEELLNALSRIKALKVAARTSAFSFKGKDVDLRDVGHKLNVATVLEGSVRKAGERLRITAQLIDVETGYHLWSETYDRELTDIFAIQDDITSRIVSALQVHLDGGVPSPVAHATRRCRGLSDRPARPVSLEPALAGGAREGRRAAGGRYPACTGIRTRVCRPGRRLSHPVRLRPAVVGRVDREGSCSRHEGRRARPLVGRGAHLAGAHPASRMEMAVGRATISARNRP